MNIALLSPQIVGSSTQIRRVQPPLGIACLAATLESAGYKNIQIIDAAAEGYDNIVTLPGERSFIKFGLENDQVIKKLNDFPPDIVGISALFSSQAGCALSLAEAVRESFPNATIVMGGIHASKQFEKILKSSPYIDYIICGEGDLNFPEFVAKIEANESVDSLPGLARRDESGEVVVNPQAPLLKMSDLPMPAWHLMDMDLYYEIGMPHNPFKKFRNFMCIMTSRGCPEKCYFCSSAEYFGYGFRALTAEETLEMINYSAEKFGVREFQIEDDTFTLNWVRVMKICEGLKGKGFRITLPNAIRADYPKQHDKRLQMFKAMKEAGFEQVSMSVEHGDQEFLDKVVGKRLELDEVVKSVELAQEAGLLVHNNFMMGFPFETSVNRQRTIDFARSLNSNSFSVSLAAPLPGTKLWDICEENDLFMPNFDINYLVYDQVNIKPFDIEPDELLRLVSSLNRELNINAQERDERAKEKYSLFKGKNTSGDRKYLSNDEV
jgi:anaerobic magnesium-protoporphyrin IX monomethyl ester cyclase